MPAAAARAVEPGVGCGAAGDGALGGSVRAELGAAGEGSTVNGSAGMT